MPEINFTHVWCEPCQGMQPTPSTVTFDDVTDDNGTHYDGGDLKCPTCQHVIMRVFKVKEVASE